MQTGFLIIVTHPFNYTGKFPLIFDVFYLTDQQVIGSETHKPNANKVFDEMGTVNMQTLTLSQTFSRKCTIS